MGLLEFKRTKAAVRSMGKAKERVKDIIATKKAASAAKTASEYSKDFARILEWYGQNLQRQGSEFRLTFSGESELEQFISIVKSIGREQKVPDLTNDLIEKIRKSVAPNTSGGYVPSGKTFNMFDRQVDIYLQALLKSVNSNLTGTPSALSVLACNLHAIKGQEALGQLFNEVISRGLIKSESLLAFFSSNGIKFGNNLIAAISQKWVSLDLPKGNFGAIYQNELHSRVFGAKATGKTFAQVQEDLLSLFDLADANVEMLRTKYGIGTEEIGAIRKAITQFVTHNESQIPFFDAIQALYAADRVALNDFARDAFGSEQKAADFEKWLDKQHSLRGKNPKPYLKHMRALWERFKTPKSGWGKFGRATFVILSTYAIANHIFGINHAIQSAIVPGKTMTSKMLEAREKPKSLGKMLRLFKSFFYKNLKDYNSRKVQLAWFDLRNLLKPEYRNDAKYIKAIARYVLANIFAKVDAVSKMKQLPLTLDSSRMRGKKKDIEKKKSKEGGYPKGIVVAATKEQLLLAINRLRPTVLEKLRGGTPPVPVQAGKKKAEIVRNDSPKKYLEYQRDRADSQLKEIENAFKVLSLSQEVLVNYRNKLKVAKDDYIGSIKLFNSGFIEDAKTKLKTSMAKGNIHSIYFVMQKETYTAAKKLFLEIPELRITKMYYKLPKEEKNIYGKKYHLFNNELIRIKKLLAFVNPKKKQYLTVQQYVDAIRDLSVLQTKANNLSARFQETEQRLKEKAEITKPKTQEAPKPKTQEAQKPKTQEAPKPVIKPKPKRAKRAIRIQNRRKTNKESKKKITRQAIPVIKRKAKKGKFSFPGDD